MPDTLYCAACRATRADVEQFASDNLLDWEDATCPCGTLIYYQEHPTIAIPASLQRSGWEDRSWHNDVCAKSDYELDPKTQECFRVWVAEENASEREYPDSFRFLLEHVRNEDEDTNGEALELYQGDSEADLQLAIVLARAKWEIRRDIKAGYLPVHPKDFSELHNHVDANGYGGAFDGDAPHMDSTLDVDSVFWDAVQSQIDQWIKAGMPA